MKKEIKYSDAPDEVRESIMYGKEIYDFLPPPELLIPKERTRKITITLSTRSIDFFKEASKKTDVPYQQMIRKILDSYTDHYAR